MTMHNKTDITHQQLFLMFDELDGKVEKLGTQNSALFEGITRLEQKLGKVHDMVVAISGTQKIERDERSFDKAKVDRLEVRVENLESAFVTKARGADIN